ncbi:MAG: NADH-quinone oxidoreductase subunit L [Candidatus Omnitrophota bacterium]|nr:NADH-quinone oxidoreductase subunit L [Candidatus Omnitrophota bacterium]
MIKFQVILLSIIFIPLAGAFLLPLAGRINIRLRNSLSLIFIVSSFLLSLSLIPLVLSGKTLIITKVLPLGFNFSFTADGLAVFMACVSSLVSAIIVLYSFDYVSHYEHQSEYYLMVTLFLGSMMGLIFSANLIFLYVFWELTAICSWRLIGFFREKHYVLRADKAFLVTFFGAVLMLIGFISIYQQAGSFDLLVIKDKLGINPLSNLTVLLILIGIFSKSATLPFHTWLPDAGVAPSPVTALLHAAVLVKIGVYVFARLFIASFNIEVIWHTVVPYIAGLSALVAAGAALIDTDFKRIVAYSTISQIGFIFLGLSTQNTIGIIGALLYILMHGFAKAGLFLCAGIVEQNTKTKDITKLGGLIKTMPVTAISFLFCAFSVMGIPPFGGFFSKYMVFSGAVKDGNLAISGIFLLGAFLTIIYLFRLFNAVFMGQLCMPQAKEGSRLMVTCVAILAALSLAGGILIFYPFKFAEAAVFQMLGMVK